jgi:predicted flavoprotein YhiN
MATDYDVIVVGCGPSGLMACGELAKRGVKVLGVDKNPDLGRNTRTASGYCFVNQPFNNITIRTEEKPEENRTYMHFDELGFST